MVVASPVKTKAFCLEGKDRDSVVASNVHEVVYGVPGDIVISPFPASPPSVLPLTDMVIVAAPAPSDAAPYSMTMVVAWTWVCVANSLKSTVVSAAGTSTTEGPPETIVPFSLFVNYNYIHSPLSRGNNNLWNRFGHKLSIDTPPSLIRGNNGGIQ